jgi:hypothetical protein
VDKNLFMTVYYDWRDQPAAADGYIETVNFTLPLASASAKIACCPVTGMVAVATDHSINIWCCPDGYFEHILELQLFMTGKSTIKHLALYNGVVACASSSEVRVLQVDICLRQDHPSSHQGALLEPTSEPLPILPVHTHDFPSCSIYLVVLRYFVALFPCRAFHWGEASRGGAVGLHRCCSSG